MNRKLMLAATISIGAAIAASGADAQVRRTQPTQQPTAQPVQPVQTQVQLANVVQTPANMFFTETTADKISLFGNRLGQANMYGFGVAANTLVYKSANTHKWFVNEANVNATPDMTLLAGRLGIGTADPNHELVVEGNDPAMQIRDNATDNSANAARLELLERSGGNFDGGAYFWWNGETNRLLIGTKLDGANTNLLVIDRASNGVGIGTQTPGEYKLAVNGAIRAKEIVVETGWSDYVFEEGYALRPIAEVKRFIDENGHLPDVPSAAEIEEKGVSLGESQATLLRKVEELTLYIIDLEGRLARVESESAGEAR